LNALLDYCQASRAAAHFLQADFVVAIADGDAERATADVDDCLAAAALICNEPAFAAQMTGIAVAGIAQWKLEILLANASLTSDQYARLDRRLKEMSDSYRMRDTILAERAYQLTVFKMAEDQGENVLDMPYFPEKRPTSARIWGPSPDEELLFLFRYLTEMAAIIDGTGPAGEARWQTFAAESRIPARHRHTKETSTSHLVLHNTGTRHRQWLTNARVALRVDRYYRNNGGLPANLKDVLDEKMPELPLCLYSGLPPILAKRGAEGFIVYVPGSNGTDDGAAEEIDPFEARSAFQVIYKPEPARP
jgi:hypothetical protein